jgi:prepilin-type N-terminal cleavage/methylation domain-containing protein
MTLVELMIVVAIVGILAAIGGVAFMRQIKTAKITRLKEFTMDAARGQRDMFSRHGTYYPIDAIQAGPIDNTQDRKVQGNEAYRWARILQFNKDLPPDVQGFAYAGAAGEACGACNGFDVDTDSAWYAIEFRQDLDGKGAPDTRVVITSDLQDPYILNEGQ